MPKLFELLAVEQSLQDEALRNISALKDLFTSGRGKFVGMVRTFQPVTDKDETIQPEVTDLAAKVWEEMENIERSLIGWFDVSAQKEQTNTMTAASIIIDGQVLIDGLAATTLLNIEGKLKQLRALYESMPVLDNTEVWNWDENRGEWVSEERTTYRTRKTIQPVVLYEATKEHPAQVEKLGVDVRSHTVVTKFRSGMTTMKVKRDRLDRLAQLELAVKQARGRANDVEASKLQVGRTLLKFINGE